MPMFQMYVSDKTYIKFLQVSKEEKQTIRKELRKQLIQELTKEVDVDGNVNE